MEAHDFSEAESLFLAEFRNGSDIKWLSDKQYYKVQTYSRYFGSLTKKFDFLQKNGYVCKMSPMQIVDYNLKLTDLKNECKIRGLKVSGKKIDLAARILESDPNFVNKCEKKDGLWICTPDGEKIVTAYYEEVQKKELFLRNKVFALLHAGRIKESITAVETYRNNLIFSDWLSMDLSGAITSSKLSLAREYDRIKIVLSETPKHLRNISPQYLEKARLLTSFDMLRGTNNIRKYLNTPTNIEGVSVGSVMWTLMLYASGKVNIADMKKHGFVKSVQIQPLHPEENLCAECKKIAGKTYTLDKVPVLPNEKCLNPSPCRLDYRADI